MRHTLTDQEIALLSAYHDGEVTAAESAEAQHLLERSGEARAWLRDAKSVHTLSVGAFSATAIGISSSAKLSGSSIVAAASRRGPGGFFSAVQSPLGMVGVAAVLVAGAIFAIMPFGENPDEAVSDIVAEAAPAVAQTPSVPVAFMASLDTSALIVPPVTASDLVNFALDGVIPINEDRTQFVEMESGANVEPSVTRSIEKGLFSLDKSGIKSLDSLAELLRSSVLKVEKDVCVRSDIPEIRLSVIDKLEETSLPKTARQHLVTARKKASQEHQQISTSLEREMAKMKDALINGENTPYVLIKSEERVESFAGDSDRTSVLEMIGPRSQVIAINAGRIRLSTPNPTIAPPAQPASRIAARVSNNDRNMGTGPVDAEEARPTSTPEEKTVEVSRWETYVTMPFMQSVTINLISNSSLQVIVSDEVDTTWESPAFQRKVIYVIGPQIDSLTDALNTKVERIVKDRMQTPEERARRILKEQENYERQLQKLIDRINLTAPAAPEEAKDSTEQNNDEKLMKIESVQDSTNDVSIQSDCLPLHDCTGLG